MKIRSSLAAMFLLLSMGVVPAVSQAPAANPGKWEYIVSPYLLIPYMEGTTGIGGFNVDVDASPSDIFSNFKFGFMLYLEAHNDKWAVSLDNIYMNLENNGTHSPLPDSVTVGIKQGAVLATGYRRILPWAEVGLGAQLNTMSASLKGGGPLGAGTSKSKTWVDPLIGARLRVPHSGKWDLSVTGDVGGFGLVSDLTWQVYPQVGYRFSRLFEANLAYRWIGIDYSSGSGKDEYVYDMVISGPQVGLVFHF